MVRKRLELLIAAACAALPAARPAQAQPPQDTLYVDVSLEDRTLSLVRHGDVVFSTRASVGSGETFTYDGKTYVFSTPTGKRTVRGKERDPEWVPPDWHYKEQAAALGLELVRLRRGEEHALSDGTTLTVRGEDVGRINSFGRFVPIEPGVEVIYDGRIYVPPHGTRQRRIPGILGTRKLDLGDGYLIHGTPQSELVGIVESHGCIRLRARDVERLYELVPIGTPVYIR